MSRFRSLLAAACGLIAGALLVAAPTDTKLSSFSGIVMTEEFKVQGGTFTAIDDKGESRTFEYNTPGAPKCVFYDSKTGRPLQPHQMGQGDEVTVAYKEIKGTAYAVKVTRTKASKRD